MSKGTTEKLIINFTPTGMIPTKEMTPHVAVSTSEIIEQTLEAYETGITIAHLHARDAINGKPTYKSEIYAEIFEGIRKHAPNLILCGSLSGRDFNEFEKRSELLNLTGWAKPDMGSLTMSSLNFTKQASLNAPDMVQALAAKMKEMNVLPELEAFDLGMVNYMHYLIRKNLIKPPYYINLLFGNIAGAQVEYSQIGAVVNSLPDQTYASLAGLGRTQLSANAVAVAMGAGVRIGLEDNIFLNSYDDTLASNIELVKRIHKLAEIHEREVMKDTEMREALNLKPGNGEYGLK